MNKVTTINLNGTAYQIEESGYDALRAYLDDTAKSLESDPDKEEIMRDFEQAIGEKCHAYLSHHKNVVSQEEIERIIAEMGTVEQSADKSDTGGSTKSTTDTPKRLYQIRQGAFISGVCNGLATYFSIDVVLVRVVFVLLALITHGGFILAYIAMVILIPRANSPEERAAARGAAFNAQGFVDQAREAYSSVGDRRSWKRYEREWKQRENEWKQAWKQGTGGPQTPGIGFVHTLLGLAGAVLAGVWIFAVISLIHTGTVFGYAMPAFIPLWAGIILLIAAYMLAKLPLRLMRYNLYRQYSGYTTYPYSHPFVWFPLWSAFVWLTVIVAIGWFAHTHGTEVGVVLDEARAGWQQLLQSVGNVFN